MITNKVKIPIHFDSENRSSGTVSNYSITLNDRIDSVISVDITSIEIPFSYYCINSTNNTINFEDNVPNSYTASVTAGNYSATEYATALETAMNAVFAGFTITYNDNTNKFTWANASQFKILSSSSMGDNIGITTDSSLATSVTSDSSINLTGGNYLFIRSKALSVGRPRTFVNEKEKNVLYKTQVNVNPWDVITILPKSDGELHYSKGVDLSTIDFQLVDKDFNEIDLNGKNWSISLLVYADRKKN